jgi:hypothetical protein
MSPPGPSVWTGRALQAEDEVGADEEDEDVIDVESK